MTSHGLSFGGAGLRVTQVFSPAFGSQLLFLRYCACSILTKNCTSQAFLKILLAVVLGGNKSCMSVTSSEALLLT